MKELKRGNSKPEDGCMKTSARCVIWNGPDIPCIRLCKGDSIEEVVYQLALLLCNVAEGVIDITTLDFKCLVEENIDNPTRLKDILQKLIDKVCELEENAGNGGGNNGGGGTTPTPIELPGCLEYVDADGDVVTALPPAEYSAYLADKICLLLSVTTTLTTNYDDLLDRITTVEQLLQDLGSGPSDGLFVTSKCISAAEPGQLVSIDTAVEAIETALCELQSLLGTSAELTDAIDMECTDLDNAGTLSDPDVLMSDLPGWTTDPTNLSQNIINLWLTLCDMRTAVINSLAVTPICALVSPAQVKVKNQTTGSFTVTWSAPVTAGGEAPVAYEVSAVEWNGSAEVGLPLFVQEIGAGITSYTYTGPGDANKLYNVKVVAIYSCGESEPTASVNQCFVTDVKYIATLTDTITEDNTTLNCLAAGHLAKTRTTKVKLTDVFLGNPAINTGSPIQVVVRYLITTPDCADIPNTSEDVTITINPGQSEASYTYYSQAPVICTDTCVPQYTAFSCVVFVSGTATILATGTPEC